MTEQTPTQPKYTPPPNKPGAVCPKTPPSGLPGRPDIVTGGMSVVITIGEVKVTIEGPMPKVILVLNWLFGSGGGGTPESVIAGLKLVFGPEIKLTSRSK